MSKPEPKDDEGPEQLGMLLVRYGPAMRGFFARRVRSASEAEDLTQEVMLRVLKRAERGPIQNVEGYLFQAAANLVRERGRQSALRGAAPAVDLAPGLIGDDDLQTPERIFMGRDALSRLAEGLYKLPELTRTVFVLNRFEEMTGGEIARRLGISISSVEKHMMRAIAQLRGHLG